MAAARATAPAANKILGWGIVTVISRPPPLSPRGLPEANRYCRTGTGIPNPCGSYHPPDTASPK